MDNTLRYERGNRGSIPFGGTKFCKCQQENVMLIRFLRRTEVVKGRGFNSLRSGRVGADRLRCWTSIPSDVPSPGRPCING